MALFSDLKLKRDKQRNLRVTFRDKPLLVIYTTTVFEIIKVYATNAFLDKVSKLSRRVDDVDLDAVKIEKMNAVYTAQKREFYKRKNLKPIAKNTRDYDYIIRAHKMCEAYECTPIDFVRAQVDGLSFVGDGVGVFPTPSMLVNATAEQRILAYLKQDVDNNSVDFVRIELKHFDRTTPVKENEKWVQFYEKMKDNDATLREITYVADVWKSRNEGRLHPTISEHLDIATEG